MYKALEAINANTKAVAFLVDILSLARPHMGVNETTAIELVQDYVKNNGTNVTKISTDTFGNLFVEVGDVLGEKRVLFTCHMDTVHSTDTSNKIFYIKEKETDAITLFARSQKLDKPTDTVYPRVVLGADDAAGMFIILNMIQAGVVGTYAFFKGEEKGCLGSKDFVVNNPQHGYNIVVSFDRRGTSDVITHQRSIECCTNAFATQLCSLLNNDSGFTYAPSNLGSYTDSSKFMERTVECTNISTGYDHEHTKDEELNLTHLCMLANQCTKLDWYSLPVGDKGEDWTLTPKVTNYYGSNYYGGAYGNTVYKTLETVITFDYGSFIAESLTRAKVNKRNYKAILIEVLDSISNLAFDIDEELSKLDNVYLGHNGKVLVDWITDTAGNLQSIVDEAELFAKLPASNKYPVVSPRVDDDDTPPF